MCARSRHTYPPHLRAGLRVNRHLARDVQQHTSYAIGYGMRSGRTRWSLGRRTSAARTVASSPAPAGAALLACAGGVSDAASRATTTITRVTRRATACMTTPSTKGADRAGGGDVPRIALGDQSVEITPRIASDQR